MLKAAIEKIQEMTKPLIHEVEGRTFRVSEDRHEEIIPDPIRPYPLRLTSLDAVVKLVKTEAQAKESPIYITIPSHLSVDCFGQTHECLRELRVTYYIAEATDIPGWGDRVKMPYEEAMIALRTQFQPTPDTDYALKLLSEITTGAKITFNDNGVATSVVTKKGIDLQSNQAIRPIIKLKPYRTFQEVEQPESEFLIRLDEKGISFIEADGGMWKLHARETIKEYLEKAFSSQISEGKIVVTL